VTAPLRGSADDARLSERLQRRRLTDPEADARARDVRAHLRAGDAARRRAAGGGTGRRPQPTPGLSPAPYEEMRLKKP